MLPIPLALLTILAGFLAWSFVEYAIHGFLSHRWRTPVSPMHWGHHESPRAVFTTPLAWVPAAAVFLGALAAAVGWVPATAFTGGLLAGFARYEYVHWRIHFRAPRSERERCRRVHHLAHHFRNPRAYHGVTTRLWDRVFGTLPANAAIDYAAVADRPPLRGASNLAVSYQPRQAWRRIVELHGRRRAVPAPGRRGQ